MIRRLESFSPDVAVSRQRPFSLFVFCTSDRMSCQDYRSVGCQCVPNLRH